METKLTLRLERRLIEQAKKEARKRRTSLSKMVADYFRRMEPPAQSAEPLPPITASILGSLRGKKAERTEYRQHLEEKYR